MYSIFGIGAELAQLCSGSAAQAQQQNYAGIHQQNLAQAQHYGLQNIQIQSNQWNTQAQQYQAQYQTQINALIQQQMAFNNVAYSVFKGIYESPEDRHKREFKKSIDTKIDSLLSD